MDKYNIVIIGAGASGMIAGIEASKRNKRILIIDKNQKPGRKICATGNGKCNYTNINMGIEYYNSLNIEFVNNVLEIFNQNHTIEYFRKLGIYPRIKNGYVYPFSEQASAVSDNLYRELLNNKVIFKFEECVINIEKLNDRFIIDTDSETYESDKVIVASGGKAGRKLGADDTILNLMLKLGHRAIDIEPALVSLISKKNIFRTISGVRMPSKVSILIDNQNIKTENGEIIFNDNGISGIPVMQLSRYASDAISKKKDVKIELDLISELDKDELKKELLNRQNVMHTKDNYTLLIGLMNNKLAGYIDKLCKDIDDVVRHIKHFTINITDTNGWDNAQVMAGGISLEDVDINMQSKIIKGLYIAGEILDVDGTCGGYNLQWAWSTGFIAGSNAASN